MRAILTGGDTVCRSLPRRFARDTSGATAIEYGLIAVGIAVFIIAGIDAVGIAVNDVFVDIAALF